MLSVWLRRRGMTGGRCWGRCGCFGVGSVWMRFMGRMAGRCGRCRRRRGVPMMVADLVAERLPVITALLEEARDALAELADLMSDDFADRAADAGRVGHRTPAKVLRVYGYADELERVLERLERSLR